MPSDKPPINWAEGGKAGSKQPHTKGASGPGKGATRDFSAAYGRPGDKQRGYSTGVNPDSIRRAALNRLKRPKKTPGNPGIYQ